MRSKPISYIARLWILPMLMALFSLSLQAQQPGKDSWDNLNRLQAGQKIKLVQMDLKSLKGQFLGFTDEMISLRIKKDEVAVPREDVLRVSLRGKGKRGKSALVGAGLGAVLGAISGAAVGADFNEAGETGVSMLVFTPIGAGVGAAVGAAVPFILSYQTIYRATKKKPGKAR